jgi:hypothetical protein
LGSTTPEEAALLSKRPLEDLPLLNWRGLRLDDWLGPWDMIWVRRNGRVEIEVVGRTATFWGEVMCSMPREAQRVASGSARINQFWILSPDFHDSAKVRKIHGDVWAATDGQQVRQFFDRHLVFSGWSRFGSAAEREAWQAWWKEMFASDPVAANQAWEQSLQRARDDQRAWEELFRKEEWE